MVEIATFWLFIKDYVTWENPINIWLPAIEYYGYF
jgi:hypothetical protein